jgi:general secretion pathway protein A
MVPFKISPNPNLLYITPTIHGFIEKIRFTISERQGLSLILGDNGMGKSSIMRYLLAEYGAEGYSVGLLDHTEFPSPYAMLKTICAQFGVDAKRSQVAQLVALSEWLIQEFKAGRTVILFIDEGQRITAELLEVVRSLLNFETYEDKLLQIVLAGTLELLDRINAKRNKALRSRIFAPCMLNPLSPGETAAMIQFRCDRAGIVNPFPADACERIFKLSQGVPRRALILCAHAWHMATVMKLDKVYAELIEAAAAEASLPDQEAVA